MVNVRDITERKVAEEKLAHQALHDPLTGLPNRLLLVDRLRNAIARGLRHDGPPPVVMFLDLDRFKLVNDSLGHGAGDELLAWVADRLRSVVRDYRHPVAFRRRRIRHPVRRHGQPGRRHGSGRTGHDRRSTSLS